VVKSLLVMIFYRATSDAPAAYWHQTE